MARCLIVKNFFSYDPVVAKPELPKGVDGIYITDNEEDQKKALSLGWNKAFLVTQFLTVIDPLRKREIIALMNCYPETVVSELLAYDYVFICDSNVVKLDSNYQVFLDQASSNYALYVTSGWYRGDENNITRELVRSLANSRWSYNFNEITSCYQTYVQLLDRVGLNPGQCPVVSAKYIGWNLRHPTKKTIADFVYGEYMKHLQGNITISVTAKLFPNDVYHYTGFINDGKVCSHLLQY